MTNVRQSATNGSTSKAEAARKFQELLLKNGALLLFPDPDLIDSDSERNVFNYE